MVHEQECTGKCAYSAITHMGFVRHEMDLEPSTVPFLQKHATSPESPLWKPASMMLGSLARHTEDYSLIQHVHGQLKQLESAAMPAKKHFRTKHTLLHSLGNSGHHAGLRQLATYLDDTDLLVQHTAIKVSNGGPAPSP